MAFFVTIIRLLPKDFSFSNFGTTFSDSVHQIENSDPIMVVIAILLYSISRSLSSKPSKQEDK